ncbi:MAG: hypothetical protein AB7N24_13190 [Dehalococcoidia bacterium]
MFREASAEHPKTRLPFTEMRRNRSRATPLLLQAVFALAFALSLACSTADNAIGPTPIALPGFVQASMGSASLEQREALRDGVATWSEYEAGVLRTIACWRDADVPGVDGPSLMSNGWKYVYTYRIPGGPEQDHWFEIVDSCWAKNSQAIEALWSYQHRPTEDELQSAFALLVECLRGRGAELPEGASRTDTNQYREQPYFAECLIKVQSETGIEGYAG